MFQSVVNRLVVAVNGIAKRRMCLLVSQIKREILGIIVFLVDFHPRKPLSDVTIFPLWIFRGHNVAPATPVIDNDRHQDSTQDWTSYWDPLSLSTRLGRIYTPSFLQDNARKKNWNANIRCFKVHDLARTHVSYKYQEDTRPSWYTSCWEVRSPKVESTLF